MFLKRFSSLMMVAAIVIAMAGSGEPASCAEAATQEKNLALLKQVEADLARKPGDVELQVRHMQALGAVGRYDDELRASEILIERHPQMRAAFKGQMYALVGLGNWPRAIRAIEKMRKLGPLSPSELAASGAVLSCTGQYREALVDLNESISRDSSNAVAFFSRAQCHYKLNGPSPLAVHDLEKTLTLDPDFPNAQKLLVFMKRKLAGISSPPSK